METTIGNLINLGGSLAMVIPKELVDYLKLTPKHQVKKTWERDRLVIEFLIPSYETVISEPSPKLNSLERAAWEAWKRNNLEGED